MNPLLAGTTKPAVLGFQGDYRWLSNFHMAPVVVNNRKFPSTEHAYQAAKSLNPKDWSTLQFDIGLPGQAKRFGKGLTIRADWNSIKLDVMREITAAKYDQHWNLRALLMATQGLQLIETNTWGDTFWGVCNGTGLNHLGKILMDYRDK